MCLVHADPGEDPGGGGEGGDGVGGGADALGVGEDPGEQRADGEAAVAPQPVDADGAGAPGGVGDVADGGEQGRVDHRRAGTQQHRGGRPGGERAGGGDPPEGDRLQQHPDDDERLAAVPVGQWSGGELTEAPHGGVERGEYADLAEGEPGGGEQQGEQTPGQPVIEVVHHAGLRRRGEGGFAVADQRGDAAGGQGGAVDAGRRVGGFVVGVAAGFPDEEGGQAEAEGGVHEAEQERCRAQPVVRCEVAGGGGRCGDGEVAGGFVEAHGQAAPVGAGEVDFHDDRGRPGQALVDPEQHVGGDDPPPGRRPDDEQRDGDAGEPTGEQDGLAAVAVGQGAGEEVCDGLGGAEGEDVGQGGGVGGEVEVAFGERGQHGAFGAEQPADEGVDRDEQGELGGVGPDPQP